MINRSDEAADMAMTFMAVDIFQNAEECMYDGDKSDWESFCGKYEQLDEGFCLSEVYMEDGKLYARVIDEEEGEVIRHLYPIGEKTFGRKGGFVKLEFGDGCVIIDNEVTCKKL